MRSIDRDLLKRAKVIAAKTDTCVNALFNAKLRHWVETHEASQSTGNQKYATLLDFSHGRVKPRRVGHSGSDERFRPHRSAHGGRLSV